MTQPAAGSIPHAWGREATAVSAGPRLEIEVADAGAVAFAAAPTLRFVLRITARDGEAVRCVVLGTQLRIAAAQRAYDDRTRGRLVELFGEPHRWATTVHSLFWTEVTLLVPAFSGSTLVDLPVPCTYDLDVAAVKYFHGLSDGDVPLELLFSGTVFYTNESGALQAVRIAMDREARFRLPVRVWKNMMAHYFPNSAWLRLHRDAFDRLYAFRAQHALGTWDATIEALLRSTERDAAP